MQQNVSCFATGWLGKVATVVAPSPAPPAMVFCDFDGPIADVSERYYSTYRIALQDTQAAYGVAVQVLSKAQFWHMKQTRVPDPDIAEWSGLKGEQVTFFLARVTDIVNQSTLLHQDTLQPGARDALLALHHQGIRIVIVTLRQAAQVLQFLYDHDLATVVSQIYGANDDTTAYPNRIEHKVARLQDAIAEQHQLGFDPTTAWMIGDTEADICAGQAAGIATIALTCGIRSRVHLEAYAPTAICDSLAQGIGTILPGRGRGSFAPLRKIQRLRSA